MADTDEDPDIALGRALTRGARAAPAPQAPQATPAPPPETDPDILAGQQIIAATRQRAPQAPPSAAAPQPSPDVTPEGGLEAPAALSPGLTSAFGRIGQAAGAGYYGSEPLVTQPVTDYLERSRFGHFIVNPLLAAGGAAVADVNSIGAGVMQTAAEAGGALDPRLARDFPMIVQSLAAGEMGRVPVSSMEVDAARAGAAVPPEAPPVVPPEGLGPQPVGASVTPSQLIGITPDEEIGYRRAAEGRKLIEPQTVGQPDTRRLVVGVEPNQAEVEQSVQVARDLKALGMQTPEIAQENRMLVQHNSEMRANHYDNIAGDANTQRLDEEKFDEEATTRRDALMADKGVASAQPILDQGNAILSSPQGRRGIVETAVKDIQGRLLDANGAPITDPDQLWGVRQHINDLEGMPGNSGIMRQLELMKQATTAAIEPAVPGFRDYLNWYSQGRGALDATAALQQARNGLFNAQGNMQYSSVQRLMKNIVDGRADYGPARSPWRGLSEDQMNGLWNLRDDLRRSSSALDLARAPGSDTVQNIWDGLRGQLGEAGVNTLLHGAVGHVLGPFGNVGVEMIKQAIGTVRAGQARTAALSRGRGMLYQGNRLTDPDTGAPVNQPNPFTGAPSVPQGGPQP
jgi:hypothetical protein